MAEKKRLNVDEAKAISDFEAIVKEFELKEKIYRILYRGKGLEFEGFRDYAPDEDSNNIDWKATARANKPLVKKYKEERELQIVIVVDVGDNMLSGSAEKLKCEYAAEVIAALSHLIVTSDDKLGFVLFSDRIVEYVPPKGGLNQLYMFIDKLADPENYGGGSRVDDVYKFVLDYLPNNIDAVIFVSDFLSMTEESKKDLVLMSSKFETTAVMVKDLLDTTLPDINKEIVIEDPATKKRIVINPKTARKIYEKYALQKDLMVGDAFKKSDVDVLRLKTDEYFVFPLAMFMQERVEKKGLMI